MFTGKRARLTLRGTLLNLDEELKNSNVVFVVGAPNLVNRGSLDDLLQGFRSGIIPSDMMKSVIDPSANLTLERELRDKAPGAAETGLRGGGGFGGGSNDWKRNMGRRIRRVAILHKNELQSSTGRKSDGDDFRNRNPGYAAFRVECGW